MYYGDILESSQIVCVAEMSPHSAKFSWSFKVRKEEHKTVFHSCDEPINDTIITL